MVSSGCEATPVGPIGVSANGRYFTDQRGEPFFGLGDTQWELVRSFALEDVQTILEARKAQGFSVLQVMLSGVGDGTGPNVAGEPPWLGDDPATPNEAYFAHVDAAMELMGRSGLVVALGVYHQLHVSRLTVDKARRYAAWVARRYGHLPNLIWATYPKAEAEEVPVVRELAAGLAEGDAGAHLITVHPDPAPASSGFLHGEPWLSFHCIQTFSHTDLIRPMVAQDCRRRPPKPVVMAEGAYEAGTEYGFEVTPLWVRRQAYWTCLAGGHHSYGHNDLWRLPPTWRQALYAPGATQLGILREVLTGRDGWWDLLPDDSWIGPAEALNVAARHPTGAWGLVYLGAAGEVEVELNAVAATGTVAATWVDPSSGQSTPAGNFPATGTRMLPAPDGWADALLLLEAR